MVWGCISLVSPRSRCGPKYGFSAKEISEVFRPFVATKAGGLGMGLDQWPGVTSPTASDGSYYLGESTYIAVILNSFASRLHPADRLRTVIGRLLAG